MKPQPSEMEIIVVGDAEHQLHQGMEKVYPYKLSGKVIDWKSKWFYVENHGLTLPKRTPGPPKIKGEWIHSNINQFHVPELLDWIYDLRNDKLTGAAVVMD